MKTKLQKTLDYQKEINQAVNTLLEHFGNECSMSSYYEDLATVQVQVMSMLQICEQMLGEDDQRVIETLILPKDVVNFFCSLNDLYKMLKPFDRIANKED